MEIDYLLKIVPTTRYQGSKRKILPWLYECLRNYEFHTVLDAFGGTGMVSYLFKRMGKRVTRCQGTGQWHLLKIHQEADPRTIKFGK